MVNQLLRSAKSFLAETNCFTRLYLEDIFKGTLPIIVGRVAMGWVGARHVVVVVCVARRKEEEGTDT